ncbi:hypothetical protein C5167_037226 [Papaver somniferum]|uniref:TOG domain-containing protein n=1 Tax=Papaver somniferum TaxID=3469 RepID=A0A4Y7I5T2_PAPSO|nr:hypothetical protein C5167_037226 [Papaver somniferum]
MEGCVFQIPKIPPWLIRFYAVFSYTLRKYLVPLGSCPFRAPADILDSDFHQFIKTSEIFLGFSKSFSSSKSGSDLVSGGGGLIPAKSVRMLVPRLICHQKVGWNRPKVVDVVGSIVEEGTRHLAIEFVITLAEAGERGPGMLLDMRMIQHGILLRVGMRRLVRLVIIAFGKSVSIDFVLRWEGIQSLLVHWSGKRTMQDAALIALAQIAIGCSKVMIKNLAPVVNMVLVLFQDPHPRVRWEAINAIGQLCTDLGRDLQVQYHHRVLPALASAMENPRVQAHAASAILNFSENCAPDILTPYLDVIGSNLLILLQNGKQMVKEGALTALPSVTDSSQELFQKYYDAVMPCLKAILLNATDNINHMLRAKSMECIILVGIAVRKEKLRDDAKQVMEIHRTLQRSELETDDPTISYMLQAWARLSKCLGRDFLPYMSVVMSPFLQSAQLKPDATITSAGSEDDIDQSDDERFVFLFLESFRFFALLLTYCLCSQLIINIQHGSLGKGETWVVPASLSYQPVKGDLIEANVVHDQLCSTACIILFDVHNILAEAVFLDLTCLCFSGAFDILVPLSLIGPHPLYHLFAGIITESPGQHYKLEEVVSLEIKKKNPKKLNHIAGERFLHDHQKCIKSQNFEIDRKLLPKTLVFDDDFSVLLSKPGIVPASSPPKVNSFSSLKPLEYDEIPKLPYEVQSPP